MLCILFLPRLLITPTQPFSAPRCPSLEDMSWFGNVTARLGFGNAVSNSRGVARERLSIILAHQRGDVLLQSIDLERLQAEVLQCVKKYISVDATKPVQLCVKQDGAVDVFEMQVHLTADAQARRHRDTKP